MDLVQETVYEAFTSAGQTAWDRLSVLTHAEHRCHWPRRGSALRCQPPHTRLASRI